MIDSFYKIDLENIEYIYLSIFCLIKVEGRLVEISAAAEKILTPDCAVELAVTTSVQYSIA